MSLAVIGPGFGRTGTMSLKNALEALGLGPCHHMEEVFRNPPQVAHWQQIAAGAPVVWDDVFAGYRAQVDWPGAHVWRQLATAYPEARVVLSVRPEEAWWTSFSNTIGTLCVTHTEMAFPPHIRDMMAAAVEMIVDQTFQCDVRDRSGVLAAYRARAEDVLAAIPRERLLVFDVAEGWEPLCRFLDVPVPDHPFPRTNSTEAFWKLVKGGG